jgi:hypothetical protein
LTFELETAIGASPSNRGQEMTYEQETANVPELSHISLALGQYAEALDRLSFAKRENDGCREIGIS